MSALRIFTRFMQLRKLGLFFKTSISLKLEFLTNVPQAKCFIIGLIIHLKTLPKCQKRKELKNIGFRGQKVQPVEPMANRLNRLRNLSTSCPRPVEDRSRDAQKVSLSPSSLFFPIEATVTCHALNTPTTSEPVDPQLDQSRLPFAVFNSRAQKPIN